VACDGYTLRWNVRRKKSLYLSGDVSGIFPWCGTWVSDFADHGKSMVREIFDDAAPVIGHTAAGMRGVVWEFFEERAMHIE
jgi:hypothetical protein